MINGLPKPGGTRPDRDAARPPDHVLPNWRRTSRTAPNAGSSWSGAAAERPGVVALSPAAELPGPDMLPRIDGFTIERELGRGAMGVVYLAHRDTPRRQVALKLLPGGRRPARGERRQWLREAEAASRRAASQHRHALRGGRDRRLVPAGAGIHTRRDAGGSPFRAPGAADAARLMETIARAVHHIHQSGLLHLDLKPSNILLDGDAGARMGGDRPQGLRFRHRPDGRAGATDTGGAGPGGTPSYMAPEQITRPRKDMTAQADIHGLGAILYHMLTGRPPYQGATVLETIDQVRRQEPVPPRRLNPAIPRDLETICLKCLEKDPARRYASAEALADDLAAGSTAGRSRRGRYRRSRSPGAGAAAGRWSRRSRRP